MLDIPRKSPTAFGQAGKGVRAMYANSVTECRTVRYTAGTGPGYLRRYAGRA